jgi:acyl-CoA thioesterase FadM
VLVHVDLDSGRPVPFDDELRARFALLAAEGTR